MFKMTHNILRNLVVKKSTRRYPFEVRETFDKVRGELVNDIARCIFCGTCEVKCPSQCIEVDRKAAVWTCDPFACVYCGVCVDTCPAKSLFQKIQYRHPEDKRVMISMQGELKKKAKDKDAAKAKESAPAEPGAEPLPADTPSEPRE